MTQVMVIAAEASADLHGSNLIRELKKRRADLEFFGIGGPRMREVGMELIYPMERMSIVGFMEAVRGLPFVRKVLKEVASLIEKRKPRLVILIDYPGFNLRLAKIAKERGIEVLYYIGPQVWAWGRQRAQTIARWVDKMAVIFAFEEEIYRQAGVDVTFVGHPLLEILETKYTRSQFFEKIGLHPGKKTLGLLPGSRKQEVVRMLPQMLAIAERMKDKIEELQVIVSAVPAVSPLVYKTLIANLSHVHLLENNCYDLMKYSDLLVVASGTATLESALFGTPLIVVYKVSPISWLIAKMVVKVNNVSLVNIVAGKRIVPEFLQSDFKADRVAPAALEILQDGATRKKMVSELGVVKERLGEEGASQRVAEIALGMMGS